ncbi:MAG: hypothetical protein JHD16_14560 [Solirubrobacteraceae bacterium]|nr:hypothetical protein [Solirubrobacteraceae bacterium]
MSPLPNDFDVAVFEGRTLQDVHTTSNTAFFGFGAVEGLEVTTWGEVLIGTSPVDLRSARVPFPVAEILPFRGQRVRRAQVVGRSSIRITFDASGILEFVEDTDQYECYEIRMPTRHIVI